MANITVSNHNYGSVALADEVCVDDVIAFTAADTLVAGTILARTTATGKLGIYATDGTGGLSVPVAVLTYDVVATAASSVPVRALVSGVVDSKRLVIDADGDNSNVTPAILDSLRDLGIVAVAATQLAGLDNQ